MAARVSDLLVVLRHNGSAAFQVEVQVSWCMGGEETEDVMEENIQTHAT